MVNLWDVTDRDIDRFFQAFLEAWAKPAAGSVAAPAVATQPAAGGDKRRSPCEGISQVVGHSRAACRLPYLIGAAPVCYGLPLELA